MTVNDIITNVRIESQEKNPSQRWPNTDLIPLVSQGQQLVVEDTLWPTSRYVFQTQTGVQFYQMPELLAVLQVYVNGQPIEPTDIETMEGDMIYFWDQTGTGGGPGGFIQTGQPPVLAGGQFTPQWSGQPPATYPVASDLGIDANTSMPWFAGRRPVYFFDGGVMGFVPPPAGAYPVVVRCVRQPAEVTQLTDNLVVPSNYKYALTWKVIELMAFANAEQPAASDQRNYAMTEYEKALRKLKKWKRVFSGRMTKGPNFLTNRTFYRRGNARNWDGQQ